MLRGKKRLKTTAGFTLVELMVTVTLMMVIIAPIVGMFVQGSRTTKASNELTIAALTAQLRMEELVGLTEDELREDFSKPNGNPIVMEKSDNDFYVEATVWFYDATKLSDNNYPPYPELANATVIVKKNKSDTNPLCSHTNTLNVALYAGGA